MVTPKTVVRQYWSLAVPTVLSGIIYTLYTLIDGIFIGRYVGENALAALNLVVPLTYVPYAVSILIGVGGATLVSRLLGQGNQPDARRAFTWALLAIAAAGVVSTLLVRSGLQALPYWLNAPPSLHDDMRSYLGNLAWFAIFANALYALEMFLRADGARAARFGVYAMAFGAVANGALDYLFIAKWGMGMRGAALATGLSMTASSMTMLWFHLRLAQHVRPLFRGLWQYRCLGRMLYNGSSEMLGAIAPAISVLAFNYAIAHYYGEAGLAAFAVLEYMTLAVFVVVIGLVQSMQPLVSFYRGAGNPDAMHSALRVGIMAAVGMSVVGGISVATLSEPLTFVFLPQGEAVWQILKGAVPWYALAFLPGALNLLATGYLSALEKPLPSAVIAVLRSWVLLLGTLWILTYFFGGSAIWLTLLVAEVTTLIVSMPILWWTLRRSHIGAGSKSSILTGKSRTRTPVA